MTHSNAPGALIAARRLADDPRAAFRAISGLVLALSIFTVAATLLATQDTKHYAPVDGAAPSNALVDQFSRRPDLGSISECRCPLT